MCVCVRVCITFAHTTISNFYPFPEHTVPARWCAGTYTYTYTCTANARTHTHTHTHTHAGTHVTSLPVPKRTRKAVCRLGVTSVAEGGGAAAACWWLRDRILVNQMSSYVDR